MLARPIADPTKKWLDANCSIIPLIGYGTRAKQASISTWKSYQTCLATAEQRQAWLGGNAYGIIMGQVSQGLFVIDFDQLQAYDRFCKQFPKLAATYRVKTSRGYHLYFQATCQIKTKRFDGGDIIGEGSYVVGPSSILSTAQGERVHYQATGTTIQQINQNTWQQILNHLKMEQSQQHISIRPTETTQTLVEQFHAHYAQSSPKIGRNNALYQLSHQAKRQSIDLQQCITLLAETHAKATTQRTHYHETQEKRYIEAVQTIKSAYKSRKTSKQVSNNQLPNSLREALLRTTSRENKSGLYVNSSSILARIIEILHQAKALGKNLTAKEIAKQCKNYNISTSQIKKALYKSIIESVSYSDKNITPVREGDTNTKTEKQYYIPTLSELCKYFDISVQSSDYLSPQDLSSHANYLQALHRAYILRSNGESSTLYCAQRLSIHPRTIQRYDEELGVIKTPIVAYEALSWHNVDNDRHYGSVDTEGITPGIWLQREDGKRFPAIKGIALQELKAGHKLIACQQKPSLRQIASEEMPITQYEVYWLALDGCKWGGTLDEFPPQAELAYLREKSTATNNLRETNTDLATKQVLDNTFTQQARSQFDALERDNQLQLRSLIAQAQKNSLPKVDARINRQLTLIKGIGRQRADKLELAGILTMLDLIALPAEKTIRIFTYEQYISVQTIENWIEEAQYLLGLRRLSTEELEAQENAKERKRQRQTYRVRYKRLQTLVSDLIAWEMSLGAYSDDLEKLSQQLEDHYLNDTFYIKQGRARIQGFIQAVLEPYLARTISFSEKTDNWLIRWGFGDAKTWKKLATRVQRAV
ncbi:MAG: hypothetical protein Phog2KO_47880 [Phototrophicaceae bacterium]